MSTAHLTIPNFRLPKRLVSWMQVNGVRERIPSAEKVFFKENISVRDRAWGLVGYSKQVGRLPGEMEDIIAECPESCCGYAASINPHEVPEKIVDACASSSAHVVKIAGVLHRRIPHLEHMIDDPETYVSYAGTVGRVPELEERILFSGRFRKEDVAHAANKLIERFSGNGWVGFPEDSPANDPRTRNVLKEHPPAVRSHMEYLGRRGQKLPEEFWGVFAGDGENLNRLAEHLRRRLPEELELTWEGAKQELVNYCCRYVKGRLPDSLEMRLAGDPSACYNYAFNVIRGFAPVRLPDNLHAFMVLGERNNFVQQYITECDRVVEYEKKYTGTN